MAIAHRLGCASYFELNGPAKTCPCVDVAHVISLFVAMRRFIERLGVCALHGQRTFRKCVDLTHSDPPFRSNSKLREADGRCRRTPDIRQRLCTRSIRTLATIRRRRPKDASHQSCAPKSNFEWDASTAAARALKIA
jgi:hypothetical protein